MRDTRRARLLLGTALIVALTLMAVDYQNGSSSLVRGLRGVAGSVFGAAERATSAVTGPIVGFFRSGVSSTGSSGQVTELRRQLIRLRTQLSAARLNADQYRQLSRLLGTAGTGGYQVVAASVIAFSQGYQQAVVLNAGSADGVRAGQTVLDGSGLVGQVIAVSSQTATVLLASDTSSVVGVRLAPGGQVGWVTGLGRSGAGAGLLRLAILDPSVTLRPGEQLVTLASVRDQPFVPGVPVGVIAAVQNRAGSLTATALVRPYADLTALGVVGIVVAAPRRDPHYSVLPARPPAHPAASAASSAQPSPSASPSASRH